MRLLAKSFLSLPKIQTAAWSRCLRIIKVFHSRLKFCSMPTDWIIFSFSEATGRRSFTNLWLGISVIHPVWWLTGFWTDLGLKPATITFQQSSQLEINTSSLSLSLSKHINIYWCVFVHTWYVVALRVSWCVHHCAGYVCLVVEHLLVFPFRPSKWKKGGIGCGLAGSSISSAARASPLSRTFWSGRIKVPLQSLDYIIQFSNQAAAVYARLIVSLHVSYYGMIAVAHAITP